MEKREVLASIPKAVNLYLIQSDFTRLPFVYCDDESFDDVAFLFDEKENASILVCGEGGGITYLIRRVF